MPSKVRKNIYCKHCDDYHSSDKLRLQHAREAKSKEKEASMDQELPSPASIPVASTLSEELKQQIESLSEDLDKDRKQYFKIYN